MSKFLRFLFVAHLALLSPVPSAAHEFWVDPTDFTLSVGATLEADLRVGQNFEGGAMSFIPRNFTRFEVVQGDSVTPVEGRIGDKPALRMDMTAPGLAIVLHETTNSFLSYDAWDRFVRFVEHKDFPDVLERHRARGLPDSGFTEFFSRHVKSLVAIGDGAGQDRAFGLRTEFVALANPYTDDISAGVPVLLLLDGEPRVQVQVELWDRAPDGTVSVTLHRTDDAGQVLLPVSAGHVYMADAVAMLEIDPEEPRNAVWQSLWASLTFAVPAD
ncbi:MAG: DUF4198 domain-containing protein [Rhodobacteraceae bacterium]|jgi:hypothetical protein|nr:DUF4198 domain-containing protein [Paracoccaceae bacterium]